MTIAMTGGGSGGHITPILAVAAELKKLSPNLQIVYIGQKGDDFIEVIKNSQHIDIVQTIRAGKFRRYHDGGLLQWLNLKTWCLNGRDGFFIIIGTLQSWHLLKKLRVSAVFVKGGYVGLPVGLAARLRRIPYVTHDSDAIPGLTNRAIAKQAAAHAVSMPAEIYKYPKSKTSFTGVPVLKEYKKVTPKIKQEYRQGLNMPIDAKVVTVTGGGLGADTLNKSMVMTSTKLFKQFPNLFIIHLAGRNHDQKTLDMYNNVLSDAEKSQLIVKGFVDDLYKYSSASDVIVTRAGATALAEFALQNLACIVIPNPALTGGHQIKNAQILADKKAIKLVSETSLKSSPDAMYLAIKELLDYSDRRYELGRKLGSFAKPNAASELAELILAIVRKGK